MTVRSFDHSGPTIAASAYVDAHACVIGDVVIGEDCSVWPMAVIRGDVNTIRIGARTNIQDGTVLHVTHPYPAVPQGHGIIIGDDVTIGHNATIHGCTIEDACLIGIGSIILDAAVIRSHVMLGAGSLVTEGKELEGGYLWLGAPARKIRPLTDDEFKWFEYSARHYVQLKDRHRRP